MLKHSPEEASLIDQIEKFFENLTLESQIELRERPSYRFWEKHLILSGRRENNICSEDSAVSFRNQIHLNAPNWLPNWRRRWKESHYFSENFVINSISRSWTLDGPLGLSQTVWVIWPLILSRLPAKLLEMLCLRGASLELLRTFGIEREVEREG